MIVYPVNEFDAFIKNLEVWPLYPNWHVPIFFPFRGFQM